MGTFVKQMVLCHANTTTTTTNNNNNNDNRSQTMAPHHSAPSSLVTNAFPADTQPTRRWALTSTFSILLGAAHRTPIAMAENWGARSFIKERYFQPGISPEDAVARIQQTTEGIRDMRHMLDTMAWRYVLHYIRLKNAYLSSDLKNAMTLLPESRKEAYVRAANELVDNMAELDHYIRTPKVYESYVYYEKTLKSLDDILAMFA